MTWLQVRPLDVITVRDGRPFEAGEQVWGEAVQPSPATVAGTVHQATKAHGGFSRIRSGLVAVGGEVLAPWPSGLVVDDSVHPPVVCRLSPDETLAMASDLSSSGPDLRLLAGRGDAAAAPRWIRSADLVEYLAGGLDAVELRDLHNSTAPEPWVVERHVGLYRKDGQAEKGYLYSIPYLRFNPATVLLARVNPRGQLPADLRDLVPFGGERGLAEVAPAQIQPKIRRVDHYPDGKVLVYLAAPAAFEAGWRPELPTGARLVAAAVAGPVPVAGWRKPGRRDVPGFVLRWCVPAGSVFWLQFDGDDREEAAGRWARSMHSNALHQSTSWLRSKGFGWCFTGTWASTGI